jgi:hypothetical protein
MHLSQPQHCWPSLLASVRAACAHSVDCFVPIQLSKCLLTFYRMSFFVRLFCDQNQALSTPFDLRYWWLGRKNAGKRKTAKATQKAKKRAESQPSGARFVRRHATTLTEVLRS